MYQIPILSSKTYLPFTAILDLLGNLKNRNLLLLLQLVLIFLFCFASVSSSHSQLKDISAFYSNYPSNWINTSICNKWLISVANGQLLGLRCGGLQIRSLEALGVDGTKGVATSRRGGHTLACDDPYDTPGHLVQESSGRAFDFVTTWK